MEKAGEESLCMGTFCMSLWVGPHIGENEVERGRTEEFGGDDSKFFFL